MDYQFILYEIDDHILTLTLNRPDRLNAMAPPMREELMDAFGRASGDDHVRAIIVTGAGRGFCAGADLKPGAATFDFKKQDEYLKAAEHRDGGGQLTLEIFKCLKPVIAAINGPAVGVGLTMTLAMDIRLASENARFGFVFTRRGIVPEACSTWFLPRIVGISQALEWAMSGRVFQAEEAREGGLVRSVHAPSELLPAARELAREIAENTSAVSVALARQMLWRTLGASHPMEAHRIESLGMYHTGKSRDAQEGINAFLEKRPPDFPGKPSRDMPDYFPWWKEPPFKI
jgi:enoyl-CoA hydratase/carnithine racemase